MAGSPIPGPFLNESPAGVHHDAHPLRSVLRRLFKHGKGYYHYDRTRQPDPGAQRYAFTNHRVIDQPLAFGIANLMQFKSLQAPQIYVAGQALTTTGLGGLQNGPLVFQPLIDPYAQ